MEDRSRTRNTLALMSTALTVTLSFFKLVPLVRGKIEIATVAQVVAGFILFASMIVLIASALFWSVIGVARIGQTVRLRWVHPVFAVGRGTRAKLASKLQLWAISNLGLFVAADFFETAWTVDSTEQTMRVEATWLAALAIPVAIGFGRSMSLVWSNSRSEREQECQYCKQWNHRDASRCRYCTSHLGDLLPPITG
jgi:hypothetical protein